MMRATSHFQWGGGGGGHAVKRNSEFRWLNTVFDTYVSFTLSSKTVDPLVTKMVASKLTTRTSVF